MFSSFNVIGLIKMLLGVLGLMGALQLRRSKIFRTKIIFVCFILILGGLFDIWSCPKCPSPSTQLSSILFIICICILYWREIKELTTTEGFYKVNLELFIRTFPDMVWMKDLDGKFTYVNEAICSNLLKLPKDSVLGRTSIDIANQHRLSGHIYTFGEVCLNSDEVVLSSGKPERFLEEGLVFGDFLALQVYKAPIFSYDEDSKKTKIIGTVGIGRDLTYDHVDHENIERLLSENKFKEAKGLFLDHCNRYKFKGDF